MNDVKSNVWWWCLDLSLVFGGVWFLEVFGVWCLVLGLWCLVWSFIWSLVWSLVGRWPFAHCSQIGDEGQHGHQFFLHSEKFEFGKRHSNCIRMAEYLTPLALRTAGCYFTSCPDCVGDSSHWLTVIGGFLVRFPDWHLLIDKELTDNHWQSIITWPWLWHDQWSGHWPRPWQSERPENSVQCLIYWLTSNDV